jgi:glyoxylase-like metal-dependent hydrolase (beta-lactamase superfamily II)
MLSRRALLTAPAILAPTVFLPVAARAPFSNAPMPAAYRFRVGSFEITALSDGTIPLTTEVFPASQRAQDETANLLKAAAIRGSALRTFVNAYLVNTGERLVLIDTGIGTSKDFGPDLGKLPSHLQATRIDPSAVDVVFLTHLHPDHIGGLAPEGRIAFPNAELVMGEAEYTFWHDAGTAARAPAEVQPFFKAAQEAVKPFASKSRRISGGEIISGLSVVAAPGHTPGHMAVRVTSGNEQLLIWGDIVHVAALQFDRPDWSIAFDTDQNQAASTRRRFFDMAAADSLLVAGMHLPFPGVGYVTRRGDAFAFVPQTWPTEQ